MAMAFSLCGEPWKKEGIYTLNFCESPNNPISKRQNSKKVITQIFCKGNNFKKSLSQKYSILAQKW